MCILKGRLSSTTKGPVTSPKEIFPETRSELIRRILLRPPRATKTLESISWTVWAEGAVGSRERSAMQSVLSLMDSMVAAERGEWRVGWRPGTHPPGNADGCEYKGVARQESGGQAGKAVRIVVKTKARRSGQARQKRQARG